MDDSLDHDFDGFWKNALDQFLVQALELLAPDLLAAIDLSRPFESLEQEFHEIFPETRAGKRFVDKLFRVRLATGQDVAFLLHIEIQSEPDPALPERMFVYRYRLFDKHPLDVYALVILADDDPHWRPDRFEKCFLDKKIEYEFRSIKLLDLAPQLVELAKLPNPFAVLVVAYLRTRETEPDRLRLRWKFEITCAICERGEPEEHGKLMLRLVDWIMRLPPDLKLEFRRMVRDYAERKNMPILMDLEIEAMEGGRLEGLAHGRVEGAVTASKQDILRVLELRFGSLPSPLVDRISAFQDAATLRTFLDRAVLAPTLEAFERG